MGSVRRAIDDLGEGMGSLLGTHGSRPALIEELLGEGTERRALPREVRPKPPRRARSRTPARAQLVRVK